MHPKYLMNFQLQLIIIPNLASKDKSKQWWAGQRFFNKTILWYACEKSVQVVLHHLFTDHRVSLKVLLKLPMAIWTHMRWKLPSFVSEISLKWTSIWSLSLFFLSLELDPMYSFIKVYAVFASKFFIFSVNGTETQITGKHTNFNLKQFCIKKCGQKTISNRLSFACVFKTWFSSKFKKRMKLRWFEFKVLAN